MKTKIFAFSIFIVTLILVSINTYFILQSIDEVIESIEALDLEGDQEMLKREAAALKEDFKRRECYISITVSHNDLMNINDALSEFVGYISVSDTDGASVTKSRLIDALEHLRRLSGLNIDSII